MRKELSIEKLKIRWGIRVRRYEEKIKGMEEKRWVKICWKEKKNIWKDKYSEERERYYNRNGWRVLTIDTLTEENGSFEEELMDRERKIEWQMEEGRIREAKYNKRYKKLKEDGETPKYLRKKFLERIKFGTGVRALAKLRCGNMEDDNIGK